MQKFRFKKKYRLKYKSLLFLLLYLLFGFIGFMLFCNLKLYSSNEEFILSLLTDSNHYKKYKYNWFNKFTNIIFSSEITKPTTLLESLLVSKDLSHYDEIYDADSLEEISQHIKDPNPSSSNKPVVYIYNSHQLENYSSTNYEAYNITPNVMMASYILREKLKEQGIEALVEESDITEFIRINNWNYNYSYLSHLFHSITSQTLSAYFQKRRLETAAGLLSENDLSITQIAQMLQYSSVYAFSKAFRTYYGVSPREYRGKQEKSNK
jgi:YesN/AraC family two-component response regulator